MSELRQSLNQIPRHRKIPAVVIDVVGNRCGVRLSTNGRALYGIEFSGAQASPGDRVLIDYSSGNPVAMVPAEVSLDAPTKAQITPRAIVTDVPSYQLHGDGSGASPAGFNKIALFDNAGSDPLLYEMSGDGFSEAVGVASAGDTIKCPPGTIDQSHTIPGDVIVVGAGIDSTVFTGTLTVAHEVSLTALSIVVSASSAGNVIGVVVPTGTVNFEAYQVTINVTNTGAGNAYSINDLATGGSLSVARSSLVAVDSGGTSYCINRASTRAVQIFYGTLNAGNAMFSAVTNVEMYGIVDSSDNFLVGKGADYTEIEPDGTLVFNGAATVWDDLRFPAALGKPGASQPSWAQFKDDGSGSTGVFTYLFDKNTDEELFFIGQMPHSWKEGTDIEPHIHWAPTDTDTGDVVWGLEYTWANMLGTYGNTTIITVTDAADGTAYKHQYADFAHISGSGKTISGILVMRVFRDANNGADTYDADAALLEFDIHYEIDTVGSRTEAAK